MISETFIGLQLEFSQLLAVFFLGQPRAHDHQLEVASNAVVLLVLLMLIIIVIKHAQFFY